jgi:hypothetical protein
MWVSQRIAIQDKILNSTRKALKGQSLITDSTDFLNANLE